MTIATTQFKRPDRNWFQKIFESKLYTAPMTRTLADTLGFKADYVRECCLHFGSAECHACPLANRIPRRDCNPPDECPTCPQRERCPCGNANLRARLLNEQN